MVIYYVEADSGPRRIITSDECPGCESLGRMMQIVTESRPDNEFA